MMFIYYFFNCIYVFSSLWLTGNASAYDIDPNCQDRLDNCHHYGESACSQPFEAWARHNCANYCNFCSGPTTPVPECRDTADDCETYVRSSCTNPEFATWAREQCRYYCRLCPKQVLSEIDSLTTTLPPEKCVDKVKCSLFGNSTCEGQYLHWAKTNCPAFCNFCTPPPTPPSPCHDIVPNCINYHGDICTNPIYSQWVLDNCRLFC
ncbi:uncharacterized protein [Haliotis cracherodii]|uniref:uncharacterized protein n=1 Tax=Haliotis cracherodii TaxID=6455 RepID=UPI0039E9FB5F